jgi:hypothetical protein
MASESRARPRVRRAASGPRPLGLAWRRCVRIAGNVERWYSQLFGWFRPPPSQACYAGIQGDLGVLDGSIRLLLSVAGVPAIMQSDESPVSDDLEATAWAAQQRQIVIDYLASQGCDHNGVSLEPRWFVSRCVAIWAVRSKANPDRVGWWAISGDLPTDYMTATHQRTAGDVLIAFARQWREAAERMKSGEQLDGYAIGDPSCAKALAPLLQTRADLLQEFGEDLNRGEVTGKG